MNKILVANRGEIACRVIRTARAMGYRTVAVFSEPDAASPHVALADEAVALDGQTATESYLRVDAILDACKRTGADAVHPGYGFLSERADFAQACADAGLVFIGPPASAIAAMGDKAGAKRRMLAAGVPCVPGYLGDDQSDAALTEQANVLGYPLLVKAVAGGGGRGMRLVHAQNELADALAGARREAASAFGDGTLMLERLVTDGRHIEIQVFADTRGNVVHLGERDCSAQRRRQKVIEESPSPFVDAAMREAMGRDAVAAAKAVGYVGAGTIEFIVDAQRRHFFLEMNTRLQVEHPVTECVTGLDLVEWQLRVAAGEPLPLRQDEIRWAGHAVEARLYAEDPYEHFAPQAGRIAHWRPARASREGARIDDGIAEGGAVSPFYDAMVAKLIVHGRDRADALRRLGAALEAVPLLGLRTNGRYLCDLLRHPEFVAGAVTTRRLDDWAAQGEAINVAPVPDDADWAIVAALRMRAPGDAPTSGPVALSVASRRITLACAGVTRALAVAGTRVSEGGRDVDVVLHAPDADGWRAVDIDGVRRQCLLVDDGRRVHLARDAAVHVFEEPSPFPQPDASTAARVARAPVAGVVAQLAVEVGQRVVAGQPLVCVEAMKMEMWLNAAADGVVSAVRVVPRDTVASGAVLVELDLDARETT
ncbi:acetyl/propionyl/methylcrotonyl-CoA carboxylase subunit alpha [Scleromatobacter humisilvae]|uniref:ATP-grasp domain-containing protein n=1 Tax=Scleromatobacter humisilvae TaxID=2897159 RepID=A0A9X2C442_9BURK|nr:biotin carboxylase N-terminal domain-containing protein [Scleromatobacter humisilvae]MCK9688610.1 ATP-grasp domain-containing protein [Scleromatobacter humisilvae]